MSQFPSRRTFLQQTGAAALTTAVGSALPAAQGPFFGKLGPSTSPLVPLQSSDLTYKGLFRSPLATTDKTPFALRCNNGTITFLINSGYNNHLYEIDFPGYGTNISTAPRASIIQDFGDVSSARMLVADPTNGVTFNAINYDDTTGLWVCGYRPVFPGYAYPDPSIFWLDLDFSSGTVTNAYGPHRAMANSFFAHGYFTTLTDSWANAFASGNKLLVGGPQGSIAAQGPVGPVLSSMDKNFNPVTTPPATVGNQPGVYQIGGNWMLQHNAAQPRPRDQNYIHCEYDQMYLYDYPCMGTVVHETGEGTWWNNSRVIDFCSGMQYVYTNTKHGFLGLAGMIQQIPGYPYVTDGMPHFWYGPQGQPCCHGHLSGAAGTGQKCDTSVGRFMFFNPSDVAEVLGGTRQPWNVPNTFANLSAYPGWLGDVNMTSNWQYQNHQYECSSRLLFVPDCEREVLGGFRPYFHVFQVAD